jgi:hypothetical protein
MNTPNLNPNGPDQLPKNEVNSSNQKYKDLLEEYAQELNKDRAPATQITDDLSVKPEPINTVANTAPTPVVTQPSVPSVLSENITIDEEVSKKPFSAPEKQPQMSTTSTTSIPSTDHQFGNRFNDLNLNTTNTNMNNNNIVGTADTNSNQNMPLSKPQNNNTFKILFFVALFIFLSVSVAVAYTVIKDNKDKAVDKNINTVVDNQDNTSELVTCIGLDNKNYKQGDSFPAADECNTCVCNPDGNITCSNQTCTATNSSKTVTPTEKPSNSTTSLKSYENKVHNFVFQYPSDWTIVERKNNEKAPLISLLSPEFKKIQDNASSNSYDIKTGDRVYFDAYTDINQLANEVYGFTNKAATLEKLLSVNKGMFTIVKKVNVGNDVTGYLAIQDAATKNYVLLLQKGKTVYFINFENAANEKMSEKVQLILDSLEFK